VESKFVKMQHTTNLQWKWDMRFNEMAEFVSKWSKDPSTKCGAVIVRPDRTVCSVGYNGFPRGMQDTEERLNNREDKYSRVVHCEVNAVLSAREPVHGYTLYTWPFLTCDRCAVIMIQAGIKRVVAPILPDNKIERWGKSFELSMGYYEEAGIEVFEI
jgi:dCMP deaminase